MREIDLNPPAMPKPPEGYEWYIEEDTSFGGLQLQLRENSRTWKHPFKTHHPLINHRGFRLHDWFDHYYEEQDIKATEACSFQEWTAGKAEMMLTEIEEKKRENKLSREVRITIDHVNRKRS